LKREAIAESGGGHTHYVSMELARRAVEMALPMMEAGRQQRSVVGSGFLHIVVLDPGCDPRHGSFEQAILYEHSLGDRSAWDADYAAFARAKARLSWQTGLDSHAVQALQPHRLRTGDTTLWGSVCLDGIVVGVSGAFPWFDEAYAGAIALLIRALAKEAREADAGKLFLQGREEAERTR